MTVATSDAVASYIERRRHVRQRMSVIVCVKLDNENGGILLDLGTGGLSFQAISPLRRDQNLVLDLKLPDCKETIQIKGTVAWLGSSHKEAGIRFRNVPDSFHSQILEWIEKQKDPSGAKNSKTASAPESRVAGPASAPPTRIDRGQIHSEGTTAETNARPTTRLPSAVMLGQIAPESDGGEPESASFSAANTRTFQTAGSFGAPPTEPHHAFSGLPRGATFPPGISSRSAHSREVYGKRTENSSSLFSPATVKFKEGLFRRFPALSPAAELLYRRRFFLVGLTSFCMVLGLFMLVTNYFQNSTSQNSDAAAGQNVSAQLATDPTDPSAEASFQNLTDTQALNARFARSGWLSTLDPLRNPPKNAVPTPEAPWLVVFKKSFLGIDDTAEAGQAFGGVSVWTDARTGYYYCADSSNFGKLKPGSIMAQSNALQSGYQPRLGDYCQ